MSGLFSPKTPKIPEPPKAPTVDDAQQAEDEILRLRRRRGLAANFLTRMNAKPGRGTASAMLGAAAADSGSIGMPGQPGGTKLGPRQAQK